MIEKLKPLIILDDQAYSSYVWELAATTDMYNEVIKDLIVENYVSHKIEYHPWSEDEPARITIPVNFLGKYIVHLVNDMVSHVGQSQWWEGTEDLIRETIGLSQVKRFTK